MDKEADTPQAAASPVQHRLVFVGKCLPGFDEAQVRDALARHLRRAPTELFTDKRVFVSDALDAVEVEITKQALEALGAKVEIEIVEAAPPMPPLGFLDLAVPSPVVESVAKETLAMTDSGRQALNDALPPSPDEALPEHLANIAAAASSRLATEGAGFASEAVVPPISTVLNATAPSSRPPTDSSSVFAHDPAAVGEPAPVSAPAAKSPLPQALQTEPSATPAADPPEAALLVNCPNCRERQPMRLLCRACGTDLKRALAAQQEESAQQRAARGGAAAVRTAAVGKTAPVADEGLRILGFGIPDHVADRFTLANGVLAIFALLLVLATAGFLWSQFRPDPVLSSPKPNLVTAPNSPLTGGGADEAGAAQAAQASGMGPPPSESEVLSRLKTSTATTVFRLSYWPKPSNKAFVVGGNGTWTWRAEMPSVTRALAEALGECESRRTEGAPDCKVVNVNNIWQQ